MENLCKCMDFFVSFFISFVDRKCVSRYTLIEHMNNYSYEMYQEG